MRLSLLLLCLLCSPALGVEPKAIIAQPNVSVATGDLCVLSAAGSIYDPGGIRWTIRSDKTAVQFNDSIVFASGTPGVYQFEVVAVGVVDGKIKFASLPATITVGQPGPVPPTPIPPGPGPTPPGPVPPGPTPPGPDRFGLTALCASWLQKVESPARQLAPQIAINFEAAAAAIASGQLPTPEAIVADIKARNTTTEGDYWLAWTSFFTPLTTKLKELTTNGQIKTAADFQQAWLEIARGLK